MNVYLLTYIPMRYTEACNVKAMCTRMLSVGWFVCVYRTSILSGRLIVLVRSRERSTSLATHRSRANRPTRWTTWQISVTLWHDLCFGSSSRGCCLGSTGSTRWTTRQISVTLWHDLSLGSSSRRVWSWKHWFYQMDYPAHRGAPLTRSLKPMEREYTKGAPTLRWMTRRTRLAGNCQCSKNTSTPSCKGYQTQDAMT